MSKKDKLLTLALIVIVVLLMIIAKGNGFRVCATGLGHKVEFQTLDDGAQFKSPVGANISLKVASSDMVVVSSVEQEGKDTVVRLTPVAKK